MFDPVLQIERSGIFFPDLRAAAVDRHHRGRAEDRARLFGRASRRQPRGHRRSGPGPRDGGPLQPEVPENLPDPVRGTFRNRNSVAETDKDFKNEEKKVINSKSSLERFAPGFSFPQKNPVLKLVF